MRINLLGFSLANTLNEIKRIGLSYSEDLKSFESFNLQQIFDYVSKQIKYIADPKFCELVMRPKLLLERGGGDCDDKTVFLLNWCKLKKIPCGFAIVRQVNRENFHHIFNLIFINDETHDVDATYPQNELFKSKVWAERKNYLIYKGE